jgi:hypothetical protein
MAVDAPTCRECGSMVLNAVCTNCGEVDLRELFRIEQAATRGPWHIDQPSLYITASDGHAVASRFPAEPQAWEVRGHGAEASGKRPKGSQCANGVLLVAARNAIPGLLALIATLRAEVAVLRDDVNTLASREAERMAEAAIAAMTTLRPPATSAIVASGGPVAPGVLLLDNTTLYYAAESLERDVDVLESWCTVGSEEAAICRELPSTCARSRTPRRTARPTTAATRRSPSASRACRGTSEWRCSWAVPSGTSRWLRSVVGV